MVNFSKDFNRLTSVEGLLLASEWNPCGDPVAFKLMGQNELEIDLEIKENSSYKFLLSNLRKVIVVEGIIIHSNAKQMNLLVLDAYLPEVSFQKVGT